MAECYLIKKNIPTSGSGAVPLFTYTGTSEMITQESPNWQVNLTSSGVFMPTSNMTVDLFVLGAGGAGSKNGYGGGGGYYTTTTKTLLAGTSYLIVVGAGGTTHEQDGGISSAFEVTANGGEGGVGENPAYIDCTMYKSTGSGIYVYGGNDVETYDYILPTGSAVHLAANENGHPIRAVITVSGQSCNTYLGADGDYYRGGIENGWSCVYSSPATGAGGASVKVFGNGITVSGAGANSGAANATLYGQGGAGNGAKGGSAFGVGGNGLVVIQNAR